MKICCFTGHRVIRLNHLRRLPALLEAELVSLIEKEGVTVFRNGGAIGFDTIAALKVLELRDRYPQIELEMWLPCRDQDAHWSDRQREYYRYILSHANRVHYIGEKYTRGCMQERNRRMVNDSSFCVAFCLHTEGGSGYTCKYSLRSGVTLHNLARRL